PGGVCAVTGDDVPSDVHAHRSGGNGIGNQLVSVGVAAHHGTNSSNEFTGRIRFGHVVVCPQFKTHHLINIAVFGRQHDDRHLRILPNLTNHVCARLSWEHQVQ